MTGMIAEGVKILILCLMTAIMCFSMENISPMFAILIATVGGILVIFSLIDSVAEIIETAESAAKRTGMNGEVINFAIKGVGLAWLTGFVSDTARDAGEVGIARKAELVGRVSVLLLCVPVMERIFGEITELFSGF